MRQTKIHLTKEDSAALKSFRSKGHRLAREVNRAHILLALDEKVPEALIMQVLVWGVRPFGARVRLMWREVWIMLLHDVARTGQPQKYGTGQQAEIVALGLQCASEGC